MDNTVNNINMPLSNYEELYTKGKFELCKQNIDQILNNARYTHNSTELNASSNDRGLPDNFSSYSVWLFVLENNIAIVTALELNDKPDCSKLDWDGVTQNLCNLHVKMKVVQAVEKLPIELQLNVVYNILWWTWMNPMSILYRAEAGFMLELFNIMTDGFNLISGNHQLSGGQTANSAALVLNQMQRTFDFYLTLGRTESYQLLEIYILTIQILLESKEVDSLADQIAMLVQLIWKNFKIRFPEYLRFRNNCARLQLFKFGFLRLNDRVDRSDPHLLMEVLCITTSLCLIRLGRTCESLELYTYETEKLGFLWNYIQAYIYYNMEELQLSLVYLHKISVEELHIFQKALYHILFGEVLFMLKDNVAAVQEFRKAAEIPEYHWLAVYHIICCLRERAMVHCSSNSHLEGGMETDDQPASLTFATFKTEYYKALKHLFEVVTSKEPLDINPRLVFEHKILKAVYPHRGITKTKLLYMMAKAFVQLEDNQSAVDVFLTIFSSSNTSDTLNSLAQSGGHLYLPPLRVIYHDAVVTMLMCGQFEQADDLCTKLMNEPQTGDGYCEGDEGILLALEEDVVALMLMAEIHNRKEQWEEENDCLNRCRKVIYKFLFKTDGQSATHNADGSPRLLHAVMARVYLKKALHFEKKKFTNDALLNFKRALEHNLGDQDVVHYYLAFSAKNNINTQTVTDNQSFNSFPVKICSSIALKYLLSDQVKSMRMLLVLMMLVPAQSEMPLHPFWPLIKDIMSKWRLLDAVLCYSVSDRVLASERSMVATVRLLSVSGMRVSTRLLPGIDVATDARPATSNLLLLSCDRLALDYLRQALQADTPEFERRPWFMMVHDGTDVSTLLAGVDVTRRQLVVLRTGCRTCPVAVSIWYRASNTSRLWYNALGHWLGPGRWSLVARPKRNMQGATLKVVTLHDPPFVRTIPTGTGVKVQVRGYLADVWGVLEDALNFTTEFYEPEAEAKGGEEQRKALLYELGDGRGADAVLSVFINTADQQAAAYTVPVKRLRFRVYVRRPDLDGYWRHFVAPLDTSLWVLTAATLLVVPPLLWLGCRGEPSLTARECFLVVLGALIQQGSDAVPAALSARTVLWLSFTLGVVLYTAYTAALVSRIAVKRVQAPFASLRELLHSHYRLAVDGGAMGLDMLQSTQEGDVAVLYRSGALLPDMDAALQAGFAVLDSHERELDRLGALSCRVLTMPGDYFSVFGAIAVKKGFPYRSDVDQCLRQMWQSGQLQMFQARWWPSLLSSCPGDDVTSITLQHVLAVVVCLSAGVALSVVLLLVERMCSVRRSSHTLHQPASWSRVRGPRH